MIGACNRARGALQGMQRAVSQVHARSKALVAKPAMRADEARFQNPGAKLKHNSTSVPWRQRCTPLSKNLEPIGILSAAFPTHDLHGTLASGFKRHSVRRSKLVVCAALAEESSMMIADALDRQSSVKILKRSADETPIHTRNDANEIVPVKVLNQRLFLRYGQAPDDRAVLPIMMGELLGTDALAMLEANERMLPEGNIDNLERCAAQTQWPLHIRLGDNLSANKLEFAVYVHLLKSWYHMWFPCLPHTAQLMIARPIEMFHAGDPLYCMKRLLRFKRNRTRLLAGCNRIIDEELPHNIVIGPPTPADKVLLATLIRICLIPVLRWVDEADQTNTLPTFARLRVSISGQLELFMQMFNAMSRRPVTHCCWKLGGGRCCDDDADSLRKMRLAWEAVPFALLLAGGDPSMVKWFSSTATTRVFFLAL